MFKNNNIVKISSDILLKLENDINEYPFKGLPMGSTLNDIFFIDLYDGKYSYNAKAYISDHLKYCKHLFTKSINKPDITLFNRNYLFTSLGTKPSLIEMVTPVVQKIGPEQCVVLGVDDKARMFMPNGVEFINVYKLGFISYNNWKAEYRKTEKSWENVIKQFIARYNLPKGLLIHLLDAMLVQSRRILTYEYLLNKVKPRAVITEHDRNNIAAPLILAANKKGIPTFTMVHGMINEYGYTPILANKVLCWGQQHRVQLLERDVLEEKIVITGSQRFIKNTSYNLDNIKRKTGLDKKNPVVVLASSNITKKYKKQLARNFCIAFKNNPDISAIVRLHPNETLDDYMEEIRDFSGIQFSENMLLTTDEIIAIADLFVVHNSGLGNDALMQNKIVVVFDCLPIILSNGEVIHKNAGMPLVKTPEELLKKTRDIIDNSDYRIKLIQAAGNYSNYICSYFDDDAVYETIKQIKKSYENHKY